MFHRIAGWRDHQDHEGLHQHDREEAMQREVCVQLWKLLDQMMATGQSGRSFPLTRRAGPVRTGRNSAHESSRLDEAEMSIS